MKSGQVLFRADSFDAVEIAPTDLPELQHFFEQNSDYFFAVNGEPPDPEEAQLEFEELPPPDMPFHRKWTIGFIDSGGHLIGMASILTDFLADGVWHIGLFIIDKKLHGTGTAQTINHALETWMRTHGARWLRLGVVTGNTRAEKFWRSEGYIKVRQRKGIKMGRLTNTVRVMIKPAAKGLLSSYLDMVNRDRPDDP